MQSLFPTKVDYGPLGSGTKKLNQDLLFDITRLIPEDFEGLRWSKKNYPGGYTSYSSITDLHLRFPSFIQLRKKIDSRVRQYIKALHYDIDPRQVQMSSSWINVMPPMASHSLHLHPLSLVSGTYYVQTPPGAGEFKIEDPRLSKMMACPPRKARAPKEEQSFFKIKPESGHLVLFESWLRHEVSANVGEGERISISFNYEWNPQPTRPA